MLRELRWRAAKNRSAARSASPTATSGPNTASTSRSGATSTTRRPQRSRRASGLMSRNSLSRESSPRSCSGSKRDLTPAWTCGISRDRMGGAWLRDRAVDLSGLAFPGADCIADGGLHGRLFVGPRLAIVGKPTRGALAAAFRPDVTLSWNGEPVDTGSGANVLDGPIQALAHLVEVLGRQAQPAAARRRDRHDRNPDQGVSGGARRAVVDRDRGRSCRAYPSGSLTPRRSAYFGPVLRDPGRGSAATDPRVPSRRGSRRRRRREGGELLARHIVGRHDLAAARRPSARL